MKKFTILVFLSFTFYSTIDDCLKIGKIKSSHVFNQEPISYFDTS